jgi:flagellar biogenesis protein FliO
MICLVTASVMAGSMYGETSTPRVFELLFFILAFLFAGFYLFIRCLKVISPHRRIRSYPTKRV